MKKYMKWIVAFVVSIVIIGGFTFSFIQARYFEKSISAEDAIEQVEKLYGGKVANLEKKNDLYEMEFERQGALYNMKFDEKTGQVTELKLLKKALTEAEIQQIVLVESKGTVENIELAEDKKTYQVSLSDNATNKVYTVDALTGKIIDQSVTTKEIASKPAVKPNEKPVEQPKPPTQSHTIISEQRAIQIAQQQLKGEVENVDYKKASDGGHYLIEIDGDDQEFIFKIQGITGEVLSVTEVDNDKNTRQQQRNDDEDDNESDDNDDD